MKLIVEQRNAIPATTPFIPNATPWVQEGEYGKIQLAKQAFLVLRSQLTEGQTIRIRLEDHDGIVPSGWRRGSKILDEQTVKAGKGVKGRRVSTLLTKRPEFEAKIDATLGLSRSEARRIKIQKGI